MSIASRSFLIQCALYKSVGHPVPHHGVHAVRRGHRDVVQGGQQILLDVFRLNLSLKRKLGFKRGGSRESLLDERAVQKQPETPSEIIKAARDKSDLTVEELTARVGISERYLYRIENEGKISKFEVLKKLIRELAIDANSIFYPEKPTKDSEVENLVRMLCNCDGRSMKIVRATAKAALESQKIE